MEILKQWGCPVVAHFPVLNKATGDDTSGLVLSQILYWDGIKHGHQFYKTDKDFSEELGIKIKKFRSAKKNLIDLGLIETGVGWNRATFYRLNLDAVLELVERFWDRTQRDFVDTTKYNLPTEAPICPNEATTMPKKGNDDAPNRNPITETTTETTTEEGNEVAGAPSTSKNGGLPEDLGKTPIARIVKVYSLMFRERFGFEPKITNWAMLGRNFKGLLSTYSEWQIASFILVHFDWRGVSGDDDFSFRRLQDKGFPIEWVPNASNAYRVYIQNTLGISFEDDSSVKRHVTAIIKPLYKKYHG